jgi:hypothetical protein
VAGGYGETEESARALKVTCFQEILMSSKPFIDSFYSLLASHMFR